MTYTLQDPADPLMVNIYSSVNNAENVMLQQQDKINEQKIYMDEAFVQADACLTKLITLAPMP
jgi:hypothetical protein